MQPGRPSRWQGCGEVMASFVIVAVLGLQTLAVVNPFVRVLNEGAAFLWPFLDYPMFSSAFGPDAPVRHEVLVGVSADGSERLIGPADLRLSPLHFTDGPIEAVRRADPASLRVYLARDRRQDGRPLLAVRLENHPIVRTSRGLEARPIEILRILKLD